MDITQTVKPRKLLVVRYCAKRTAAAFVAVIETRIRVTQVNDETVQ